MSGTEAVAAGALQPASEEDQLQHQAQAQEAAASASSFGPPSASLGEAEGPPPVPQQPVPGSSSAFASPFDDAVLKLKGLPYATTEEQVYQFFAGFKVKQIAFVDEPDGRPSGLAFAEFETKEESLRALSKNGEYIGERYVRLLHVPKSEMEEQVRLGTLAIPGAAAKLRSRLLRQQQRVVGLGPTGLPAFMHPAAGLAPQMFLPATQLLAIPHPATAVGGHMAPPGTLMPYTTAGGMGASSGYATMGVGGASALMAAAGHHQGATDPSGHHGAGLHSPHMWPQQPHAGAPFHPALHQQFAGLNLGSQQAMAHVPGRAAGAPGASLFTMPPTGVPSGAVSGGGPALGGQPGAPMAAVYRQQHQPVGGAQMPQTMLPGAIHQQQHQLHQQQQQQQQQQHYQQAQYGAGAATGGGGGRLSHASAASGGRGGDTAYGAGGAMSHPRPDSSRSTTPRASSASTGAMGGMSSAGLASGGMTLMMSRGVPGAGGLFTSGHTGGDPLLHGAGAGGGSGFSGGAGNKAAMVHPHMAFAPNMQQHQQHQQQQPQRQFGTSHGVPGPFGGSSGAQPPPPPPRGLLSISASGTSGTTPTHAPHMHQQPHLNAQPGFQARPRPSAPSGASAGAEGANPYTTAPSPPIAGGGGGPVPGARGAAGPTPPPSTSPPAPAPASGGGAPPGPPEEDGNSGTSVTVKVRGLPYRCSPAEILAFFSGYQYLPDSLQLGLDNAGRPSGEAWLSFVSPQEAQRAAQDLNRRYLGPRYLELSAC